MKDTLEITNERLTLKKFKSFECQLEGCLKTYKIQDGRNGTYKIAIRFFN